MSCPADVRHRVSQLPASSPQRKQLLGESLYLRVLSLDKSRTGKITGMLLELPESDVLELIDGHDDAGALNNKVREANRLLDLAFGKSYLSGDATTKKEGSLSAVNDKDKKKKKDKSKTKKDDDGAASKKKRDGSNKTKAKDLPAVTKEEAEAAKKLKKAKKIAKMEKSGKDDDALDVAAASAAAC